MATRYIGIGLSVAKHGRCLCAVCDVCSTAHVMQVWFVWLRLETVNGATITRLHYVNRPATYFILVCGKV